MRMKSVQAIFGDSAQCDWQAHKLHLVTLQTGVGRLAHPGWHVHELQLGGQEATVGGCVICNLWPYQLWLVGLHIFGLAVMPITPGNCTYWDWWLSQL